jgi:P-type Ca2+ transporter type 2C
VSMKPVTVPPGTLRRVRILPGRLRAEVFGLRENPAMAERVERAFRTTPGVEHVEASPLTGRVLVVYDGETIAADALFAQIYQAEAALRRRVRRRASHPLGSLARRPPRSPAMLLAKALEPVIAAALAAGVAIKVAARGHSPAALSDRLNALSVCVNALNGYPHVRWLAQAILGRRISADVLGEYASIGLRAYRESVLALTADAGSSLLSFLEQSSLVRAQRRARRLLRPQGHAHLRLGDGREIDIPISELQPGEVIRLEGQRRVPADGVIEDGIALIDESGLTNRAFLTEKVTGHAVFMGTRVVHGSPLVRITATGDDTRLGQLLRRAPAQRDGAVPASAAQPILRASAAGLALSGLTLVITRSWQRALAVLAMLNPSTLIAPTLAAFGSAIEAAAAEQARILRRGGLAALAHADVVLFGKTGTLTAESPAVEEVAPLPGVAAATVLCLAASALRNSTHPLNVPLLEKALELGCDLVPATLLEPSSGHGVRAVVEGAPVLVGGAWLMADERISLEAAQHQVSRMEERGSEVLYVARGHRLIGLIGLRERLLPGAREAVRGLREAGIAELGVLSADPTQSAGRLAEELGIHRTWSGVDDEEKRAVVRELQRGGRIVAVVGASASDMLAMAEADVAVGISGPDWAPTSRTADILLLRGHLSALPALVALGRALMATIERTARIERIVAALGAAGAVAGLVPFALADEINNYLMLALLFNARRLSLFRFGEPSPQRPAPEIEGPQWHALPGAEAARSLDTNEQTGLSAEEARRRSARYGLNELVAAPPPSFGVLYVRQLANAMTVLLWGAAMGSALVGELLNAALIGAVLLVNAALGAAQEYRGERAAAALRGQVAPTARCLRDGDLLLVPATELVPGDIVLLQAGDTVPADARIVESYECEVEESMLTGESGTVHKQADAVRPDADLADRASMVHMGSAVTRGRAKVIVVATGMNSAVGRIAGLLGDEDGTQTPLQVRLVSLSRSLLVFSAFAGAAFIGGGLLRRLPLRSLALGGASLATAAVPEGLPGIVTIALSAAVQRMSRRSIIVRRMSAVETLGRVTVICCDKTGTLTQNRMAVRAIASGATHWTGDTLTPKALRREDVAWILTIGAVCNDASVVDETLRKTLGGSTEGALLLAALDAGLDPSSLRQRYERVAELPFSTERAFMAAVCRRPTAGLVLMLKGAPETVLEFCDRSLRDGEVAPLDPAVSARMLALSDQMAYDSMRVLAMAYLPLDAMPAADWLERPRACIFAGLVGMSDPLRPEVRDAVGRCERAGVRVVMATGDHRSTAIAIARQLGLVFAREGVLDGPSMAAITEDELELLLQRTRVFARVTPEQKLQIIRAMQARGDVVAMTGDGVNDAPAVKRADVGIAMGHTGTEVTRQASSIVLGDDSFVSIVEAIEEGRGVRRNLRRALSFLLGGNLGEALFMVSATLLTGEVPLSPLHLLLVNLFTDALPVMALAGVPAPPGAVERPGPGDLFDRRFFRDVTRRGVATGLAATAVHMLARRTAGPGRVGSMTLAGLVGAQLIQARRWRRGEPADRFFDISLGISWAALSATTMLAPLQRVFGTSSLAALDWAEVLGISIASDWIARAPAVPGIPASRASQRYIAAKQRP